MLRKGCSFITAGRKLKRTKEQWRKQEKMRRRVEGRKKVLKRKGPQPAFVWVTNATIGIFFLKIDNLNLINRLIEPLVGLTG